MRGHRLQRIVIEKIVLHAHTDDESTDWRTIAFGIPHERAVSDQICWDADVEYALRDRFIENVGEALIFLDPPTHTVRITHDENVKFTRTGEILVIAKPVAVESDLNVIVTGILELTNRRICAAEGNPILRDMKLDTPGGIEMGSEPAESELERDEANQRRNDQDQKVDDESLQNGELPPYFRSLVNPTIDSISDR